MRLSNVIKPWPMMRGAIAIACFVLLVGVTINYVSFVKNVHLAKPSELVEKADGIVVLTGDANRISEGIKILEEKQARRLLISGVGEHTSREDLANVIGHESLTRDCCIDLDRKALDTEGNAFHAAQWARLNGFEKLIIVTSDYHMPRSLYLMRERMPEIELVPVAVESHGLSNRSVFARAFSPLVMREYAKYVVATLGIESPAKIVVSALSGKVAI